MQPCDWPRRTTLRVRWGSSVTCSIPVWLLDSDQCRCKRLESRVPYDKGLTACVEAEPRVQLGPLAVERGAGSAKRNGGDSSARHPSNAPPRYIAPRAVTTPTTTTTTTTTTLRSCCYHNTHVCTHLTRTAHLLCTSASACSSHPYRIVYYHGGHQQAAAPPNTALL
jgi:hypothetical protein